MDQTRQNPRVYEEPHHLGIVRYAIWVDDIDLAYGALCRARWEHAPIHFGGPPEEWDFGEFGTHRAVNLWDPEGVASQRLQEPKPSAVSLHPYSRGNAPTHSEAAVATTTVRGATFDQKR